MISYKLLRSWLPRLNILACLIVFVLSKPVAWGAAEASENTQITGRVMNAVTGQYLNRARVFIPGTGIETYTDSTGTYRLVNLPEGSVAIEIFYTDLDRWRSTVEITAGQRVVLDAEMKGETRYGPAGSVARLDPFVVAADRETDANAIAAHEQRYAPNIKNVIATDAMGDIPGSNIGELMKFIPGISAEYSSTEIVSLNVRGIDGEMTTFSVDGAPMASANINSSRDYNMSLAALNDIARIEVTKVPLPSNPADTLAGSVNMVSKSVFERSRAQLRVGVNVQGNSLNLDLKRTPDAKIDGRSWKLRPGFNFDYALPISKNFGFVLTGIESQGYNEQNFGATTWTSSGTGTGASFEKPYLSGWAFTDAPMHRTKQTYKVKADWRVTPDSVLTFGMQYNSLETRLASLTLTTNAGANGTPTPATGVPLSHGPDFTIGATGRGAATLTSAGQTYLQRTNTYNAKYRYDNGIWMAEGGLSYSRSDRDRNDFKHGNFTTVTATFNAPVRISYLGFEPLLAGPRHMEAFNAANQPVDLLDSKNYTVSNVQWAPVNNTATDAYAFLDVRRRIDWLPFPASLQIGPSRRVKIFDFHAGGKNYSYHGPSGVSQFRMQVYDDNPVFGPQNMPWTSTTRAYEQWQLDQSIFVQSPAQLVASEIAVRTNSERIEETVDALYLQFEGSMLKNRLRMVTGVRYEKTTDDGIGLLTDPNAVWERTSSGTFARDAAGNRIRRADAGAVSSMEQARLTHTERGYHANRSYDGYYPSAHFTYNITSSVQARLAYARTYGRPNFVNIIPRSTFNESNLSDDSLNDPSVVGGTINMRNTGLIPWTANNYDFSMEYYSDDGAVFTAGVFRKDITNFFGEDVRLATPELLSELGLDSRYVGWNIATQFNSGAARVSGIELSGKQPLRRFGQWGRPFTIFANATKLDLDGDQDAQFSSFVPETANAGLSFNYKAVSLRTKFNYRGLNRRAARPASGPNGFGYAAARSTWDVSFNYQLSKRFTLDASVVNLFNVKYQSLQFGDLTPQYARQVQLFNGGAAFNIGISSVY